MAVSSYAQDLLDQATAVLAISDEDLIYKGVVASVAERMMELKKATARLQEKYGSLEELEQKIQEQGVSPDDHSSYTDLLEWRARERARTSKR
jgi:peptidoglycan hydrolase CwlO-like protein